MKTFPTTSNNDSKVLTPPPMRLNQERQKKLEPTRLEKAIQEIEKLGLIINMRDSQKIRFYYDDAQITYYVYSGWATGQTIQDGRGLNNLLKQLTPTI